MCLAQKHNKIRHFVKNFFKEKILIKVKCDDILNIYAINATKNFFDMKKSVRNRKI